MARPFQQALLLYGLSLVSVLVSQSQTMVVCTGDTITLQCSNVTTVVGHTAWFKQVNGSEPVCISSMYGFNSTPDLHNGFQRRHFEMFSNHTAIFLKITKVEIADCGLYFCGLFPHSRMFFVNATYLKVKGHNGGEERPESSTKSTAEAKPKHCNGTISLVGEDDDGTTYLPSLVVILGVVTAVLLIVILILVLKIRRDTKTHNTGIEAQLQPQNSQDPDQDPDSLNYAALSFRQKRSRNKKTAKGQMMEMESNVVYAATR
uniref:Immunoglobulin V-set domain-containing protein n=1 Tax=Salmo trutta TaxID=8032 RepID=A0A674E185_SALTR